MANLAGEYKGKMMTWDEIVKTFHQDGYLTNYEEVGSDIIRGRV